MLVVHTAKAQESIPPSYSRNAIYGELLGQGILYSINYDYRTSQHISIRAGLTSWFIPGEIFLIDGKVKFKSFLLMGNYLTGNGNHHFEAGAGIMPCHVSFNGREIFWGEEINEEKTMLLYTITLGYRSQPMHGLLFRIGLTPVFSFNGAGLIAGLSLGYAF